MDVTDFAILLVPGRESGFAATAPLDFAARVNKKYHEITTCWWQNGSHFRSLSRKSTKRNAFSKVRCQKLDWVVSDNRFATKLDWDRKSRCI